MICDVANLLDTETKNSIDRRAAKMWEVEFAVAVIPSMLRMSWFSSTQYEAEYYANTLLEKWGVGDSSLQNGVLIFLSVDDRVIFISLGTQIQARLSSLEVERVISHVSPLLKLGEYGSAIERAIIEINLIITRGVPMHTSLQKEKDNRLYMGRVLGPWVLVCLGAVMLLWILYSRREETKLKKCRDELRALLIELCLPDVLLRDSTPQFFTASCPLCSQLYLPTSLRTFDCAINMFLSESHETGSYSEDNYEDSSAENLAILPEAYEAALIKFIETSSKMRSHYQENGCDQVDDSLLMHSQEHDLLLEADKNFKVRLQSDLDREDVRNPARFSCGHILCLSCLRSLTSSIISTCPICELDQYQSCFRDISSSISNPGPPQSFKSSDLIFRIRTLRRRYPFVVSAEIVFSLESAVMTKLREESVKIVLELCCELNRKLVDIEMRKRHIDDRWKEPGRLLSRKSD